MAEMAKLKPREGARLVQVYTAKRDRQDLSRGLLPDRQVQHSHRGTLISRAATKFSKQDFLFPTSDLEE